MSAGTGSGTMLIAADRLIDGVSETPLAGATLEVAGDRIVAVHQGPLPPHLDGAEVMRFPGCTILPGLIDTHVHLNLPGDGTVLEDAMREPEAVLVATATASAARALAAGITTVRDVGALHSSVIGVRRAIERGLATGARILACGAPLTITGGHTWHFGGETDGVDALRQRVRALVKSGADFIKVMGSGGGTVGTAPWRPAYSLEEMTAIVDEAHRNDRRVTVHCLCATSIEYAITAGVDQIEHASFIVDASGRQVYEPRIGERLAASGIPVTGTLAVSGSCVNATRMIVNRTPAEEAFLSRWEDTMRANVGMFTTLRSAGVTFVAGTDAGWRYTAVESLPLELEMMQMGGMTAMDTLIAATGGAARAIGLADQTGALRAGLAADVIVVEGNPLETLDALRDVRLILKGGVRHAPAGRAAIPARVASLPA